MYLLGMFWPAVFGSPNSNTDSICERGAGFRGSERAAPRSLRAAKRDIGMRKSGLHSGGGEMGLAKPLGWRSETEGIYSEQLAI